MPVPPFQENGDLPPGVHRATLAETLDRFGSKPAQRRMVGQRLERIYELAQATTHLRRFIVFGSFVTSKVDPNDVDLFLVMDDTFDVEANEQELQVTLERIRRFQAQLAHPRKVEKNAANYHAAASGFLAEIDRMQLEVREFLCTHPAEVRTSGRPKAP